MSRAETTSAKNSPTTSPQTICCAPRRKSQRPGGEVEVVLAPDGARALIALDGVEVEIGRRVDEVAVDAPADLPLHVLGELALRGERQTADAARPVRGIRVRVRAEAVERAAELHGRTSRRTPRPYRTARPSKRVRIPPSSCRTARLSRLAPVAPPPHERGPQAARHPRACKGAAATTRTTIPIAGTLRGFTLRPPSSSGTDVRLVYKCLANGHFRRGSPQRLPWHADCLSSAVYQDALCEIMRSTWALIEMQSPIAGR